MKMSSHCPACGNVHSLWTHLKDSSWSPTRMVCPFCREVIRVVCSWTWPLVILVLLSAVIIGLGVAYQLMTENFSGLVVMLGILVAFIGCAEVGTTALYCSRARFEATGKTKPRIQFSLATLGILALYAGLLLLVYVDHMPKLMDRSMDWGWPLGIWLQFLVGILFSPILGGVAIAIRFEQWFQKRT